MFIKLFITCNCIGYTYFCLIFISFAVRTVRSRWKSLRDSYVKETKHKLSLGSGGGKPKRDWRYSQEMAFLTPHLAISHPKALQIEDAKIEDEDNIDVQESMETYFVDVDSFQEHPSGGHFMGALLDYSAEKLHESSTILAFSEDSDVDSFFKGVAEVVKKLTPVNQVKIQKDIVNLVLDMKLKEVQENNNDQ